MQPLVWEDGVATRSLVPISSRGQQMREPKRLIILDTSVLVNDFWLVGASFRTLRDLLNVFDAHVFLPELVVDETLNKFAEVLAAALNKSRHLDYLLNRKVIARVKLEATLARYKDFIRDLFYPLSDEGGEVTFSELPYPEIPHSDVVERLLQGKRPFRGGSDREKGYRDYLIWLSVVEIVRDNPGRDVIFVSENVNDFGAEADKRRTLHSDLLADLPAGREVEFHPSVSSLIERLLSAIDSNSRAFLGANPDLVQHLTRNVVPELLNKWFVLEALRDGDGRIYTPVRSDNISVELGQVTPLSTGTMALLVHAAYNPEWTYEDSPDPIRQNSDTVDVTLEVRENLEVVSADINGDPLDLLPNLIAPADARRNLRPPDRSSSEAPE